MTRRFLFVDFDNTLMETERLLIPSLVDRFNMLYAAEAGRTLSVEDFHRHFQGMAREGLCRALSDHFGIHVEYPLLYANRDWLMMEYVRENGVSMAPHLIETLTALQQREFTFAIVSNNTAQRCLAAMRYETTGRGEELAAFFGTRVFEAGDVQKPNPEVYRRAMIQLEATPTASYAVEDSPTGVRAAVGAGMKTFGFTAYAEHPAARAAELLALGAVACFDDWAQLPGLLGN